MFSKIKDEIEIFIQPKTSTAAPLNFVKEWCVCVCVCVCVCGGGGGGVISSDIW